MDRGEKFNLLCHLTRQGAREGATCSSALWAARCGRQGGCWASPGSEALPHRQCPTGTALYVSTSGLRALQGAAERAMQNPAGSPPDRLGSRRQRAPGLSRLIRRALYLAILGLHRAADQLDAADAGMNGMRHRAGCSHAGPAKATQNSAGNLGAHRHACQGWRRVDGRHCWLRGGEAVEKGS